MYSHPASCAELGEQIANMVIAGLTPEYDHRVKFWTSVWDEIAPTIDLRPAEHIRDLVDDAKIRTGMHVLDLGTGTGLCASMASQLVGSDGLVVGIDISPEMLRLASAKRPAANIRYRLMDAERLNFPDDSFDVVVASMMLMTISNPMDALRSVSRVLVPGGRFATTTLVLGSSPRAVLVDHVLRKLPEGLVDGMRLTDTATRVAALEASGFTNVRVTRRRYVNTGQGTTEVEETSSMRAFLTKMADQLELPDLPEHDSAGADPASWIEFTSCVAR